MRSLLLFVFLVNVVSDEASVAFECADAALLDDGGSKRLVVDAGLRVRVLLDRLLETSGREEERFLGESDFFALLSSNEVCEFAEVEEETEDLRRRRPGLIFCVPVLLIDLVLDDRSRS